MNENQPRTCATCGKAVIEANGVLVHVGGGTVEQKCKNCGWAGGQVGRYQNCPRCGDGTQMVDDHSAS